MYLKSTYERLLVTMIITVTATTATTTTTTTTTTKADPQSTPSPDQDSLPLGQPIMYVGRESNQGSLLLFCLLLLLACLLAHSFVCLCVLFAPPHITGVTFSFLCLLPLALFFSLLFSFRIFVILSSPLLSSHLHFLSSIYHPLFSYSF